MFPPHQRFKKASSSQASVSTYRLWLHLGLTVLPWRPGISAASWQKMEPFRTASDTSVFLFVSPTYRQQHHVADSDCWNRTNLISLGVTHHGARNSLQERKVFTVTLPGLASSGQPCRDAWFTLGWAQGKWPISRRRKLRDSLTDRVFWALAHTVSWEVAAASCMVANSKTIFEVKLPPQQQRFTLTH